LTLLLAEQQVQAEIDAAAVEAHLGVGDLGVPNVGDCSSALDRRLTASKEAVDPSKMTVSGV
jgi:hypothetical protein